MKMSFMKKSPLFKILNNTLELPTPSNISMLWNIGSLLGLCLMMQIITGFFLTLHYSSDMQMAFNSIIHICRDVNYGWLIRTMHANGASFFFICLFSHIGRSLYYNSFKFKETWLIGTTIFLMVMACAFLGYILPWGQMSFWGATVITNLMSAIPYIGNTLVIWIWGGFAVDKATLNRFYSFHFILPLIVTIMVMIHLLYLHQTGSSNPLGTMKNIDKIPFNPYFTFKDIFSGLILVLMMLGLTLISPYLMSDPDNYTPANPLVTPIHIQPEWYFLYAYTMLRSIPNKLGGVIALASSIMILYLLPFIYQETNLNNQFYPMNKILFWMFTTNIMLLTWLGTCPVENPYVTISQLLTMFYFLYYPLDLLIKNLWTKMLFL